MADSLADVDIGATWVSAYSLSGISVGGALIIQNKSISPLLVWISPSAPAADFRGGVVLNAWEMCDVTAGETGCFIYGVGKVSIQRG